MMSQVSLVSDATEDDGAAIESQTVHGSLLDQHWHVVGGQVLDSWHLALIGSAERSMFSRSPSPLLAHMLW